MPYPVRYSTRSYKEYAEILDYVFKKFGVTVAVKVDMYFESIIDQIAKIPSFILTRTKRRTSGVVSSVRKQHCIIVSTGKMSNWLVLEEI